LAGPSKQAWVDKMIEIRQGDALSLFNQIEDSTIDLLIADPPYNLNKNYGNDSDSQSFGDYIVFTKKWVAEAKRVLKPTGTMYVFMGFKFISYLYQILEQDNNLLFNNWICWYYTQGVGKKKGFSPRHDDILMFTKTENITFNLDSVRVPQKFYRSINNMRGANPGDVWEFSHVHYCHENRQPHPTQKPEGLLERIILASSNPKDLVLDPFSGSGTTLRVCQQLDRNCVGFELNEDYVSVTQKRLNEPFDGFDSIDPRMNRVPKDLNDNVIREQYLENHLEWFLKNQKLSKNDFFREVNNLYGLKTSKKTVTDDSPKLF
jgi:DNA modification methylase